MRVGKCQSAFFFIFVSMKNVRLLILLSILSLFSGSFASGLSSFTPQINTTEWTWSSDQKSLSRTANYQSVQGPVVNAPDLRDLSAAQQIAGIYYGQLLLVQFIHQKSQFRQIKPGISLAKTLIPAAKYQCRPAFG